MASSYPQCVLNSCVAFWRNRSTATVVPDASASQASSRARHPPHLGNGHGLGGAENTDQTPLRLVLARAEAKPALLAPGEHCACGGVLQALC
jgi:hypothetical protein